jgi:hypothetical protein
MNINKPERVKFTRYFPQTQIISPAVFKQRLSIRDFLPYTVTWGDPAISAVVKSMKNITHLQIAGSWILAQTC